MGDIYQIRTRGDSPAGQLPITEEQLRDIDSSVKEEIRNSVKKALDSPLSPITNLEEDSYAWTNNWTIH